MWKKGVSLGVRKVKNMRRVVILRIVPSINMSKFYMFERETKEKRGVRFV